MKLLFVTQVVDQDDSVLGAYHGWISELAKRVDQVEVACLYEGTHTLPSNVSVHSLGKEKGRVSRLRYAYRFLCLAWKLRHSYDRVFVHMNQEYLLIAGLLWRIMGKPAYMWRNHYAGSWRTDLAAAFCTRVFCTSRYSYTARYGKTELMPIGVDTTRFSPDDSAARKRRSILFLARMAPSKDPVMIVEALHELRGKGSDFSATFVGSPLPKDEAYYHALTERITRYGLSPQVTLLPEVPNRETPELYRQHEIFVNCSPAGMFDKTLIEAAASGCLVLARSPDFVEAAGREAGYADHHELASRLEEALSLPSEAKTAREGKLRVLAARHSLAALMDRLIESMTEGHASMTRNRP